MVARSAAALPIAEQKIMTAASVRLDIGGPDHFAPLLGLVGDKLTEVPGRARKYAAAEVGKPRAHLGVGERSVDFRVELFNNFVGLVLGRANTPPTARLVARHETAYRRHVRQSLGTGRRRHR